MSTQPNSAPPTRRPEILFPLFAGLDSLPGVGPKTAKLYEKLDATRVRDILFTPPHGLIDRRLRLTVEGALEGDTVTVEITVGQHYPLKRKGQPYKVHAQDSASEFLLVFFHAKEDWLRRSLPMGQKRVVSGKLEIFDGLMQMVHPDHILTTREAEELPPFEPVYPLTAGVSQRMAGRAAAEALSRAPELPEWLDPALMSGRDWPDWSRALHAVHRPETPETLNLGAPARDRLAYDELLSHQLALALARAKMKRGKGAASTGDGTLREKVRVSLPYAPTDAQTRAIAEIEADMASDLRMLRLLQGDVGSGKTLVALMAMLVAAEAGGQAALMAPTEILARQHMDSIAPLAEAAGVEVALLTGRDKGRAREGKLMRVASGDTRILIGTHALFQKDVAFRDLRLAVVDEQHRFGVDQRMELASKSAAGADVLVMTATPIPRTLALASYGDMDASILDEKPPGRQPVTTALVSASRYEEVVGRLKAALADGRRAYWVCPLVEESEDSDWVAAEDRAQALRAALGPENVGLVHGQMHAADKDAAMADFIEGRTRLLVATTVIEVGVNVPEATIIVIEQAERFGLAQLHQLRGRVGRSDAASTCVLMYSMLTEPARARLQIMRETEDGFRIAEEDLKIRGAGDLLGVRQSGLPNFRIADLELDGELMRVAQDDARLVLSQDPDLTGKRGGALRVLLYLHDRDAAVRYLSSA